MPVARATPNVRLTGIPSVDARGGDGGGGFFLIVVCRLIIFSPEVAVLAATLLVGQVGQRIMHVVSVGEAMRATL